MQEKFDMKDILNSELYKEIYEKEKDKMDKLGLGCNIDTKIHSLTDFESLFMVEED